MRSVQGRRPRWTLTAILALMLAGCGMPGMVPAGHTLPAAAPTPASALLPPVKLPQDEAPHTDLIEWWYYTGHLHGLDAAGLMHEYGFELTFFQVLRGNVPPIYIGHYAVTDLTRGQFHYDQRQLAEPQAMLPNGTTTGFDLAIGDWTVRGLNGHDQLAAGTTDYAINLTLDSQKPPALHNGGIISFGVAGTSYYYSRTHMAVTGSVEDHGAAVSVTGLAWMDHQWGNFLTVGGGIGWDWFSIQLDDGTDAMVAFIHDAGGKVISTIGTQIDAQGQATELPAIQLSEQALDHWTSPATHITYPSGWRLVLPAGSGPTTGRFGASSTLIITPALRDQELVTTQTTGNTYWEGACNITGTVAGQQVTGQGYTELTGY